MLGEDSYIHTYLADFAPTADENNPKTKEKFWEIRERPKMRYTFFVRAVFFEEENASYSVL